MTALEIIYSLFYNLHYFYFLFNFRSTADLQQCPVATLSNMGNTCFLNSVLYALRFAPTFLHNLHHLIEDLGIINARINQTKLKSSSLGRNVSGISGPSSRSTSSKVSLKILLFKINLKLKQI